MTLESARGYALRRGLCANVGPFSHLCTRWAGHDGQHQGVRQENTAERVSASWD